MMRAGTNSTSIMPRAQNGRHPQKLHRRPERSRKIGPRERVFKHFVLGMPLYTNYKPCAEQAYSLDLAVGRHRFDAKFEGWAIDPLRMQGIDHNFRGAKERGQYPAWG